MTTQRDPEAFLPLRPAEALILVTLATGHRHGYAIRQQMIDDSGGTVTVEPGTLYRYIRRLEDDGLLAQSSRKVTAYDDPRCVYYRMTPLSHRVLAAEMHRMRSLLELAEAHRIIGPRTA